MVDEDQPVGVCCAKHDCDCNDAIDYDEIGTKIGRVPRWITSMTDKMFGKKRKDLDAFKKKHSIPGSTYWLLLDEGVPANEAAALVMAADCPLSCRMKSEIYSIFGNEVYKIFMLTHKKRRHDEDSDSG